MKTLWEILEDASPNILMDAGSRRFFRFNKFKKTDDRNGNGDDVFTGSNVKRATLPTHDIDEDALDEAEKYRQRKRSEDQIRSEINGHRRALGRSDIKKGTSRKTLAKHMMAVHRNAAYGDDPWATEDDDRTGPPRRNEDALDEISGKTLGSYIQKARADVTKKIDYAKELDDRPEVRKHSVKRDELYARKEYNSRGESKHRKGIEQTRDREDAAKKKIDPDYRKNTNWGKRHRGIEKAAKKLMSGKLSENELTEAKKQGHVAIVRKALEAHGSHHDSIGKNKEGHVVIRDGYFYRHGKTSEHQAARVKGALDKAGVKHTIVTHGDHWAPFRGGAGTAQSSHFYTHVKVHDGDE